MTFTNYQQRQELENYILSLCEDCETVLIRGSTANGPIREYSDVDVEAFGKSPFRPIYKFCFFQEKIILLTIFYMGEKAGNSTNPPAEVKVLKGNYAKEMKTNRFAEGPPEDYTRSEWVVRKRQVIVDEIFKYLRHRSNTKLSEIEKKLTFDE